MRRGTCVVFGCLWLGVFPPRTVHAGPVGTDGETTHPWREAAAPLSAGQIRELGFEPEIVQEIDGKIGSRAAFLYGRGGRRHPPIGIAWTVASTGADAVVRDTRKELAGKGYVIFIAERSFGTEPDRIGLVRATDPLAPILLQGTAGPNVEVSNQEVLSRLRDWAERAPFDLVGAGPDWIELEFRAVPAKLDTFAEEIRDLAPDSLGRDGEALERLRSEIRRSRRVFLWWE